MDLCGYRSEWRNDVILFSEYGLRSEYYRPFNDPLVHSTARPLRQESLYIYCGFP